MRKNIMAFDMFVFLAIDVWRERPWDFCFLDSLFDSDDAPNYHISSMQPVINIEQSNEIPQVILRNSFKTLGWKKIE